MLTPEKLLELSVSDLEKELKANAYSNEVLTEALGREVAGQQRKTAIEAIEQAIEANDDVTPEPELGATASAALRVAKGKAVTSLRGILGEGTLVSARDFNTGTDAIDKLVSIGVLEAVEAE